MENNFLKFIFLFSFVLIANSFSEEEQDRYDIHLEKKMKENSNISVLNEINQRTNFFIAQMQSDFNCLCDDLKLCLENEEISNVDCAKTVNDSVIMLKLKSIIIQYTFQKSFREFLKYNDYLVGKLSLNK